MGGEGKGNTGGMGHRVGKVGQTHEGNTEEHGHDIMGNMGPNGCINMSIMNVHFLYDGMYILINNLHVQTMKCKFY